MADVNSQTSSRPSTPRLAAVALPTLFAAFGAAVCAAWGWWLHPGGVASPAVSGAAGVVLAVLLLIPAGRWALPVAASGLLVALVGAANDAPPELTVATALAVVVAALAAAVPLRWYARGEFRLGRVREFVLLAAAAAVGGVLGAAVQAAGVALAHDPSLRALWRSTWPTALAITCGLVLVPTAVVVLVGPIRARLRRGSLPEGLLLVLALAAVAVGVARAEDPIVFAGAAVLIWAALRFGPAAAASAGIVLVATASWSAARVTGPFTGVADSHTATTLLQAYAAVALFAVLALAFAVDERNVAELGRQAATERFRRTFHDSPVAMAVTSVDGRIVETNRALCQLLATADHELVGTELRALRPDDTGEVEIVRTGAATLAGQQETRLVNGRGSVVHVEISESPLRRPDAAVPLQIVVLRDVTERANLRQQLLQAQKMESVGRLAGGIAHDFNNVLAVMRGQVELLQDDLEVLDTARARIDSVQRATDRAAALTDDLMSFSRHRVDEPEPFDVHDRLQEVQSLYHQVLGNGVSLELELNASPATIVADPNRIEQALLNLVVNARDAMPSGGRLTIATCTDAATRDFVLTVTDTGAGMDPVTEARIFEPFFTTKPRGFGTGLGLSTTDDIVRSAGGTIAVESRRGHGTSFILTFPALNPRSREPQLLDDVDDDVATVLVVDDESDVRGLIAEILRGSGYHVVVAADGEAAISVLERAARPVDLLVTDVVMPVMSGTDLAARVTARFPSTRVLFVSGFVPAGSPSLRGAPLVAKPLHRSELLDAVHGVLDGIT